MSAASQNGQLMSAASQNGQLMSAPPPGSPYIAAAPMIRKMVTPQGPVGGQGGPPSQQQKLYNEEMMLEAQAVSQAPSDVSRDEG